MGKLKKKKTKRRKAGEPYSIHREGDGDELMAPVEDTTINTATKTLTRGMILQRHKLEYKKLRDEIRALKTKRLKLNKRNTSEKQEKKAITKQIKELQEAQKKRQQEELEEFDQRNKLQEIVVEGEGGGGGGETQEGNNPTTTTTFQFTLPVNETSLPNSFESIPIQIESTSVEGLQFKA